MVERLEGELGRSALGPNDGVGAFVQPDRRAVPRDSRQLEHQRLERRLLLVEPGLKLTGVRARLLRFGAKLSLLFRRGILEPGADRVALGAKSFDLCLEAAHFRLERQQCIEIELDALVADGALDRLAVRLDEFQSQHWRLLA